MNRPSRLPFLILLAAAITAAHADGGPHSAVHTLSAAPAALATPREGLPPQGAQTGGADSFSSFLPTSLAWQDGGRAFYTSDVNAINCVARAGGREWLATQMGVKSVDLSTGLVRHYTRLDGLPGDRVVAVAATSPDAAYCVTLATLPSGPAWAVCRFDAQSERWVVEREVAQADPGAFARAVPAGLPLAFYGALFPPDEAPAFLASGHGLICVAPEASVGPGDPLLLVRRLSKPDWVPAAPGASLRAGVGPLRVVSLQSADDGSLWLGTNRGLWRYSPARGQWAHFLPDELILRAMTHGGDVWAVVAGQPLPPPRAMPQHLPRLIRLDQATGVSQSWTLPAGVSPFDTSAMDPTSLAVGNNGRVWLCEGNSRLWPGSCFCALDPATGQWQVVPADSPGTLAAVPDGALPLPLQAVVAPAPEYARRFPEWFCPDEPGPMVPRYFGAGPSSVFFPASSDPTSSPDRYEPILMQGHYPSQLQDPGGATWSLAENPEGIFGVIRTGPGNTGRQVFPWPGTAIQINPPINTVGYVGGDLLVTTEQQVWALNLTSGVWAKIALPTMGQGGAPLRLIAQGDHAWVGDGMSLARYDAKTRLANPRFRAAPYRRLLAVTGPGRLWLVDEGNSRSPGKHLYRVEPGTQVPVEVTLTLPPALCPRPRSSELYDNGVLEVTPLPTTPDPVAVSETPAGDIVWCMGWVTLGGEQVDCLIGYDPDARRWTAPQPAGWDMNDDLHPITVGHEVYVPAPSKDGAVWRYDTLARAWACAAGPLKDNMDISVADGLSLVSVNPDALWCLDGEALRLCRFDRHSGTWAVFPCPVQSGGYTRTDKATRVDDSVFVASGEGLWRFDISLRTWQRLPIPDFDRKIEFIVGDIRAIWGKTRQGVARFDKATLQWTAFNRPGDAPTRFDSNEMAADGEGVWLYGNSPAYRLDPATGRWSDMTRGALANPSLTLSVNEVVPDGNTVWLLPGGVRASRNQGMEVAEPVLGRYRVSAGKMDWVGPPGPVGRPGRDAPGDASLRILLNQPSMMLVEQGVVWVGTQGGILRYDKTSSRLSRFVVPPQYPLPADFTPNTVVRDGDALWLISGRGRLRWTF